MQEYKEGTSPYSYDKDWYEHLWDFVCGFVAGDFIHDTDSIATTLGQIASSFIPLVDVRDVIGNLVHGDFLFAGLSATGLIPVGGDLAKTAGKVGKFVRKNIDDIAKVSDILEFLVKNLPDALPYLAGSDEFADAMKQLSKVDTSKITKKQTDVINEALKKAGMSEYAIKGGVDIKIKMQKYIDNIVDASGKVDINKMNALRLAIQKGTFSPAEIRDISKKMSELGITEVYESIMKKINFGTYLKNMLGVAPSDMINPHAHHILFKTGNGALQQQLVKEGQEILRKHRIDPILGVENLVWAPNGITGQHNIEALRKVVETLKSVDKAGGDYDDIVDALRELGDIASQR